MIELVKSKMDCCGCTACMNICPTQAIEMVPDEEGFIYPEINRAKCVECGLCIKTCAYKRAAEPLVKPLAAYAALNKDDTILASSSSGGVFGALASLTLANKGVVFGCAFNDAMEPRHIGIEDLAKLKLLQGSKYVQSSSGQTFREAEQYLKEDRMVLYTGTPCQIDGLKAFLGKEYDNLITADIICHGVPSAAFFQGYVKEMEGQLKGRVIDFKFRDKSAGWGLMGKVLYEKNGIIEEKVVPPSDSYYYLYFLNGDIYRENCYECKYAGGNRPGDVTMGDYWGIEQAHPEIEVQKGVSVLLVNSEKGRTLLEKLEDGLYLTRSTFEQAIAENLQLRQPTGRSPHRDKILRVWREGGHQAVAAHQKRFKWLKKIVPGSVKTVIKKIIS